MSAPTEDSLEQEREYLDFFAWLDIGSKRGWVSTPVCVTHDGLPSTEEEDTEWEEGFDPCVAGMRVWLP